MPLKTDSSRVVLTSPTDMPRACGFLWNRKMMIQANCRGFATAQHMQPEPLKYAYAPNLEARTFMQPEQPYYAHHPGRFVYIRDNQTGEVFSAHGLRDGLGFEHASGPGFPAGLGTRTGTEDLHAALERAIDFDGSAALAAGAAR